MSSEDDDAREVDDREDESDTEALEDLGDFHEEIGAFDFLFGCTPGDVVRKHVSQHGLGQVDREITKEDEAASYWYRLIKGGERAYKNGIHTIVSNSVLKNPRCPRRYSRRQKEILPPTGNTIVTDGHTSRPSR
jgi:hypothetical protein